MAEHQTTLTENPLNFQMRFPWEACREALHEAGIFPIPRFTPDLAENQEEPE